MKRNISQYIIGSLFLIIGITSCSIETDGVGGLEGYWHLV